MRKSFHTNGRLAYKRAKNGRFSYPWAQMAEGDYIIVPRRLAKRATSAAYMWASRRGRYLQCRRFGASRTKIVLLSRRG